METKKDAEGIINILKQERADHRITLDMLEAAGDRERRLLDQRDELLAALETILEADSLCNGNVAFARAAIRKAKGE